MAKLGDLQAGGTRIWTIHDNTWQCLFPAWLNLAICEQGCFIRKIPRCPSIFFALSHSTPRCPSRRRLLHTPLSMLEFGCSCFRTFLASDSLRLCDVHCTLSELSWTCEGTLQYRLYERPATADTSGSYEIQTQELVRTAQHNQNLIP